MRSSWWIWVPWLALLSAVAAELIAPGTSTSLASAPFLLSAVLLGLPHGATDLTRALRASKADPDRRLRPWILPYLGLLGASLALLLIAPRSTLVGFALLSAYHFGQADAEDLREADPTNRETAPGPLWALARGLFIVAMPLAFAPAPSLALVTDLLTLLGRPELGVDAGLVQPLATGLVLAATLMLGAGALTRWQTGDPRVALVETLELALLGLSFVLLHPVFAIGLYFLAWHGLRQCRRLGREMGHDDARPGLVLWRVHHASLPLLVPSLAVIATVGLGLGLSRPESWTALLVAGFVVVTLPHDHLNRRLRKTLVPHIEPMVVPRLSTTARRERTAARSHCARRAPRRYAHARARPPQGRHG